MTVIQKVRIILDQALRIRNLKSLYYLASNGKKEQILKIAFKGQKYNIKIRGGTFDKALLVTILSNYSEYPIAVPVKAKTILDIGANIGISSLYLHGLFPDAEIYSFEPLPENMDILKFNAKNSDKIKVLAFGLGTDNGLFDYIYSNDKTNLAGGGFISEQAKESLQNIKSKTVKLEMRNANSMLQELKINKIDIIKIDTEGAEYDILTSMDQSILKDVKLILGECHNSKDYLLLHYLSEWFELEFSKNLKLRNFVFTAVNKQIESWS